MRGKNPVHGAGNPRVPGFNQARAAQHYAWLFNEPGSPEIAAHPKGLVLNGARRDGTFSGGVIWMPYGAVRLHDGMIDTGNSNGVNDNIHGGLDSITYACWYRHVKDDLSASVLVGRGKDGAGSGWNVILAVNAAHTVTINPSTLQTSAEDPEWPQWRLGEWQHVVLVFAQTSYLAFYRNGRLKVKTATTRKDFRTSSRGVRFGDTNDSGSTKMRNVEIAEVRIWIGQNNGPGGVLTEKEVWDLYNGGPHLPFRVTAALQPSALATVSAAGAGFHYASSQIS